MFKRTWTAEREAQLARLWQDDSMNARRIGIALGCTRNAVLGKRLRMGLPNRVSGGGARGMEPRVKKPRLSRLTIPDMTRDLIVPPPRNVKHFGELQNRECRWPVGHLGESCAGTRIANGPYCETHTVMGLRDGKQALQRLKSKDC